MPIIVNPKRVDELPDDKPIRGRTGKWWVAFEAMAAEPDNWFELRRLDTRSKAHTIAANFSQRTSRPKSVAHLDFEFKVVSFDEGLGKIHAVFGRVMP